MEVVIKEYLESRRFYAAAGDLDKVAEIDRVIFGVRSSRYLSILVMRYINCFTIREMAETLHCSRRSVLRQLNRARLLAEQIYNELYS